MTIDLTENKIPFGLLSKEEQEHLHHWLHGVMVWEPETGVWSRTDLRDYYPQFVSRQHHVFRTIPAPKRETVWVAPASFKCWSNIKLAEFSRKTHGGFAFRIEYDAETGDNPTIVKEVFDE